MDMKDGQRVRVESETGDVRRGILRRFRNGRYWVQGYYAPDGRVIDETFVVQPWHLVRPE